MPPRGLIAAVLLAAAAALVVPAAEAQVGVEWDPVTGWLPRLYPPGNARGGAVSKSGKVKKTPPPPRPKDPKTNAGRLTFVSGHTSGGRKPAQVAKKRPPPPAKTPAAKLATVRTTKKPTKRKTPAPTKGAAQPPPNSAPPSQLPASFQ
eukprot:CAMPEP_0206146146 /NCGR_PEP_ID=MMETSP1473-20131121/29552_1 /ASSEMBLY_ACC=CAM_ASM_001109 /TAXON_ID=1461547 /ORGANISM="Stichococcus sp, Strain RCC1054" /LENGTH=148 /DNA_ID=CAMNT_0053542603 /DNA_START=263 /DNA_END=706 /DNA_ORIENTATION=-